jgi:small-conductance mechanosensitive channel
MSHNPQRFRRDLNYLIYKHLTAGGIEIPNPQRCVHIRGGTLKVENVTKRENTDALEASF